MSNTTYATIRCTYVELRDESMQRNLVTMCGKHLKSGVPFAIENFTPLTQKEESLLRAYMKYRNSLVKSGKKRRAACLQALKQAVGANRGFDVTTTYTIGEQSGTWEGLIKKATTRVYLTADGYDIVKHACGSARAYKISNTPTYVLSPFITPVDVSEEDITEDPNLQVDVPEITAKKKNSNLGKILLAVAGWLIFR